MTTAPKPDHRSGFVGIIGKPNVGKSTLLNYFIGEKVSIVSAQPQTTRRRILSVLTRPEAQVIFLDSPGFHEPQHALGRSMMEATKAVIDEADILLVMVDGVKGINAADKAIFEAIRRALKNSARESRQPVALLVVNKADIVKKPRLLPILDACAKTGLFADCIPVSALTGVQMDILLQEIIRHLPEGPQWYDPKQTTDQTETQRIEELIREQILNATRQEVPHAAAVAIEQMEESEKLIKVQATIIVERPGQKAILIGRGGSMLKTIGQAARKELERLLGRKVFLGLWVKVVEQWRQDERFIQQLGLAHPED